MTSQISRSPRRVHKILLLILFGLAGVTTPGEISTIKNSACSGSGVLGSRQPDINVTLIAPDLVVDGDNVKKALCEPSAALPAPWGAGQILIGDNEADGQLYVFTSTTNGLRFEAALDMPPRNRPLDIEALAQVNGNVLIVGSHSGRRCQMQSRRQRLRLVGRNANGKLEEVRLIDSEERWQAATKSQKACLEKLFTNPVPFHAQAVCRKLLHAIRNNVCSFNIEGSVATPNGRVWLGLRAPLVDDKAVLLRMTRKLDELRFDRVVLIDLDGRGIRELAPSPDGLDAWGLAGPPLDGSKSFQLWWVPLADLATQVTLKPTLKAWCLPGSSEGLVIQEGQALIVVDGEDSRDARACKRPGGVYSLAIDS